jgi:hypothetical protein
MCWRTGYSASMQDEARLEAIDVEALERLRLVLLVSIDRKSITADAFRPSASRSS